MSLSPTYIVTSNGLKRTTFQVRSVLFISRETSNRKGMLYCNFMNTYSYTYTNITYDKSSPMTKYKKNGCRISADYFNQWFVINQFIVRHERARESSSYSKLETNKAHCDTTHTVWRNSEYSSNNFPRLNLTDWLTEWLYDPWTARSMINSSHSVLLNTKYSENS